jgi:hypothetical protein
MTLVDQALVQDSVLSGGSTAGLGTSDRVEEFEK